MILAPNGRAFQLLKDCKAATLTEARNAMQLAGAAS